MTKKWEYKYAIGNMSESDLNEYGQDGWELVGFRATGRDFESEFYFKRPIVVPSFDNGWIEWIPGTMGLDKPPYPLETKITVQKRHGDIVQGTVGGFTWVIRDVPYDIVAYKIGG